MPPASIIGLRSMLRAALIAAVFVDAAAGLDPRAAAAQGPAATTPAPAGKPRLRCRPNNADLGWSLYYGQPTYFHSTDGRRYYAGKPYYIIPKKRPARRDPFGPDFP